MQTATAICAHSTTMPPPLASSARNTRPMVSFARAWRQVLTRDPAAGASFVYAVRSTKIYCRPTCPSRRPARANVEFFANAVAAEQDGYRACKRCRPDRPAPQSDPRAELVAEAARRLAQEPVRLADLACELGVSRLTLLRAFHRVLGITPAEFVRTQRVDRFRRSLQSAPDKTGGKAQRKNKRITDAIYDAGFNSSSRLYESSARSLGMTPRTLRAGGEDMAISYTITSSPLGRVLVAATDLGVCAIVFGHKDAELVADLRARFPCAALKPAKPGKGWLAGAVAFIASQTTEHPFARNFPLDLRATAFQHRVWKALQQIPRGETSSYSEIARKLGSPAASRAVGRAIATNPVAIVVPCHRVIGKDGSLTGYRWGLDRKRKLLAAEGALPPEN